MYIYTYILTYIHTYMYIVCIMRCLSASSVSSGARVSSLFSAYVAAGEPGGSPCLAACYGERAERRAPWPWGVEAQHPPPAYDTRSPAGWACGRFFSWEPTCWIGIHVFLGRSHTNMNTVFRLVDPLYDMDMYIFKVIVFIKQAEYE